MVLLFLRRLVPAAAILALIAACGGGDRPADPAPSASPPRIETPNGAPVSPDLERADQLYYEGAVEEALAIYNAAAASSDLAEKRYGLWSAARIQAQTGQNGDAARKLEAFRATSPPADDDRAALFLLGKARFALGDFAEAREAFQEYIDRAGPAWPYAMLFLAQIAIQDGAADEAVAWIGQALLSGLPASVETESLIALAEAHQQAGDAALAIAHQQAGDAALAIGALQRAADAAPTAAAEADALQRLADAAADAGRDSTAAAALARLIVEFPATDQALEALERSELAGSTLVSSRDRAYVLFRHGLNDQARTAFQQIVDSGGGDIGEAQYYLGILAERAALWEEAVVRYDASLAAAGAASLRAQAAWDRATVLERLGRTSEAIAAYASVADILATHEMAAEGVFRAGLLSYLAGNPGDASLYWERALEVAPDGAQRARADFWLAKAAQALGDEASAQVYYAAAAGDDPLGYYGMRAAALIAGDGPLPQPAEVPAVAPDWGRFESWLAGWAGPEDTTARDALFAGEPWLRAVELLHTGLGERADEEFSALIQENAGSPWLTYRLLRAIGDLGRPWLTSPNAIQFLRPGAPPEAFQLMYPLEYYQLAVGEALKYGYSPLLLLSLIRQESLYNPRAVSVAGAMGLTQVIPSTADDIARALEAEDFRYADLLRPRVAVQFGAYYLGSVLEGFGGETGPALAGYNGGPANAGRWWEAGGGDRDLFLELIDFPETRAYVELVLENYARYLFAYGLAPGLSLPLGPASQPR